MKPLRCDRCHAADHGEDARFCYRCGRALDGTDAWAWLRARIAVNRLMREQMAHDQQLRALLDAPPDEAAPTPREQRLADQIHPSDLTDRMLADGATVWGLAIRADEDVDPGVPILTT